MAPSICAIFFGATFGALLFSSASDSIYSLIFSETSSICSITAGINDSYAAFLCCKTMSSCAAFASNSPALRVLSAIF